MTKTIEIQKTDAEIAYKNADESGKKLLENLLGKENILPLKVTERIKTFNDVLKELGIVTPSKQMLLDYSGTDPDVISSCAHLKLTLIARVLNEGWKPDWTNTNEYKYVPWFKHKSGFGLSFYAYGRWRTDSRVGSRLCFKSREVAQHVFETFKELYEDYLLIG